MTYAFDPAEAKNLRPINDHVLVSDMVFTERLSAGGIVLMNDDAKVHGIRPRWAKVYAVGPKQEDVTVGQYILVEHGRWTRGIKIKDNDGEVTIRRIDPENILAVSDEPMVDETMGRPL